MTETFLQATANREKLVTKFINTTKGMKLRDIVKLAIMFTPNEQLEEAIKFQENRSDKRK